MLEEIRGLDECEMNRGKEKDNIYCNVMNVL